MTTRGAFYRCHLFTFGGPQTEGVTSEWTQSLAPITEGELADGERVELHVVLEGEDRRIGADAPVRFEIYEEDWLLSGGTDDAVHTILTPAAQAAGHTGPDDASRETRPLVRHATRLGQSVAELVGVLTSVEDDFLERHVVLVDEAGPGGIVRQHVVTAWRAAHTDDAAGNDEYYFLFALGDTLDDRSDGTLDVSSLPLPDIAGLGLGRWRTTSAMARAGAMIDDDVPSAETARAAGQLLHGLPGLEVLEAAVRLRALNRWQRFGAVLQEVDLDLFLALWRDIDPESGPIMPGDVVRVSAFTGSSTQAHFRDWPVTVGREPVELPDLREHVDILGLRPADAATAIASAYANGYLRRPVVRLSFDRRGAAYAGVRTLIGRQDIVSRPVWDTSPDAAARDQRESAFYAYVSIVRPDDEQSNRALTWYYQWITRNRMTPEFLTRQPHELWGMALEASRPVPPPAVPLQAYVDFMHTMERAAPSADGAERTRHEATKRRYLDWVSAHLDDDAALRATNPGTQWGRAAAAAIREEVETAVAAEMARQRREADDRRRENALAEAGATLDAGLDLMRRTMWRPLEPSIAEDRESGIGYLIWHSELEVAVRRDIANRFLSRLMGRMDARIRGIELNPINAQREWLDFQRENPELLLELSLAESEPEVERYEIPPEEEPAWQTVSEAVIGMVPIVGQIVAIAEVTSGYTIFGRRMTTMERAVMGAFILVPAAARVARGGVQLVRASRLVRLYNLTGREADAVYRGMVHVLPGSPGARLLTSAANDLEAGVRLSGDRQLAIRRLLGEMGLANPAVARNLGVRSSVRIMQGAELATVEELEALLARAIGDPERARAALAAMSTETQNALRAAARHEPWRLTRALQAEAESTLAHARARLQEQMRWRGMADEQWRALDGSLEALNNTRRTVLAAATPRVAVERLVAMADARALRDASETVLARARQRLRQLRDAGRTDAADDLARRINRMESWANQRGLTGAGAVSPQAQAQADALRAAVERDPNLMARVAGGDLEIRRLWMEYAQRTRRTAFAEYVQIRYRHFRGYYGETEVAFRIADEHILLKAPDAMVTLPGTDLVAIPRGGGTILLIDNKAFSAQMVDEVSALQRNLPRNIESDLAEFSRLAGQPGLPTEFADAVTRLGRARDEIRRILAGPPPRAVDAQETQELIGQALQAPNIDIRRVVTNAGGEVRGITEELEDMAFDLMDVN